MNRLDFLAKTYALLHNYHYLPYWLLTPIRKLIRICANYLLPTYLAKLRPNKESVKANVIVSFTSFPTRINEVWQVVECMMRQTYRPQKIILWLSKEQFPIEESIPQSLREYENGIFEIRIVDGDIRSHKKYLYAFNEFPNDYIFLIDDDIYYPTDLIEKTWKAHLVHPDAVICNYGVQICCTDNNELLPYKKWPRIYKIAKDNFFFGSGGGTLICPSKLYHDVRKVDLALRLTPIADDIWLNAMVNLAGIEKVLLDNGQILPIYIKRDIKLADKNRGEDQNDKQLRSLNDYYNKKGMNPFSVDK